MGPLEQSLQWRLFQNSFYYYFLLCWVFVAMGGLSVVAESGGYSLVAVCRLILAVASLVEKGL